LFYRQMINVVKLIHKFSQKNIHKTNQK